LINDIKNPAPPDTARKIRAMYIILRYPSSLISAVISSLGAIIAARAKAMANIIFKA